MAILRQVDPQSHCKNCGAPFNRWQEEIAPTVYDPWGAPPRYVTKAAPSCYCHEGISNGAFVNTTNAKETKLAKQFDTTEVKNTALNTIQSKVDTLERALFDRAEALAKVEAAQNKVIADASLALDRVLMEAFQSGITEDDFDLHLPDYKDNLSVRLQELRGLVHLDTAAALV